MSRPSALKLFMRRRSPGVALFVAGGALVLAGCSLDRSGVAGDSQPTLDASRDASSDDASTRADAESRDAQTVDSCVASSESCDGRDSDCDGRIDEGIEECGDCEVVVRAEGSTYLFCEQQLDYDESREACQAFGYDLVLVDDATENEFLRGEANQRGRELRLGLDDRAMERTFVWVDGTVAWSEGRTLTYVNWLGGQPDDFFDEDCVILRSDGKWNDSDCDEARFICESVAR